MTARKKGKATRKTTRAKPPATVDHALTPADGLTDEIRTSIVQRLAMYDGPSEVAAAVNEEFGVTISRQQAQHYDPTVGRKPAKKWCDLFDRTRDEFLTEKATIPAAQRAVRVHRLARMAERAERSRNSVLAAALYEQIAKEVGEAYTNRHKLEHAGKDGAPLAGVTVEIHNGNGTAPIVEVIR